MADQQIFDATASVQCDISYATDVLELVRDRAIYLFGEGLSNRDTVRKLAEYMEEHLPKLFTIADVSLVDWTFLAEDVIQSMQGDTDE